MSTRFQLRLTGDAAAAAEARRMAEQALRQWRLARGREDPLVADALIVVTELVENVVKHTGDGGDLNVLRRPGTVVIEVADTSPQPPVLREPDLRRASGRGLRMIDALADRWGVRPKPDGKVVWVELRTTT